MIVKMVQEALIYIDLIYFYLEKYFLYLHLFSIMLKHIKYPH